MPKFMIDALSQYRMVYVIEADTEEEALEFLEKEPAQEEFGQKWLGEVILSSREVTDQERLKVFDELNDDLFPLWSEEQKLATYIKVEKNT